jgi:proline racemase
MQRIPHQSSGSTIGQQRRLALRLSQRAERITNLADRACQFGFRQRKRQSVIPEIGGTAFITGRNDFYFDPADPFGKGFILR